MRDPQLAGLRAVRAGLTALALALLVWLGIAQTNRDNQLALRHAPVLQPSQQLKQGVEEARNAKNQDDDVSKIVGIATFIVLLLQTGVFAKQAGLMKRQADIYDRQAVLMEGQIALSRQQLKLSRQEAAYARRPHFRVRFARLVKIEGEILTDGRPVTVILDVLNNGQADAVMIGSHFEIFWTDKGLSGHFPQFDDSKRNEFATRGQVGGIISAGGGNLNIEMSGYRIMGSEAQDVEQGRNKWAMYLIGWIGYRRTDNTSDRFFDFGLQLQPGTGRFLPMDDPDYSHDPDGK